jgi:hypothetical protein
MGEYRVNDLPEVDVGADISDDGDIRWTEDIEESKQWWIPRHDLAQTQLYVPSVSGIRTRSSTTVPALTASAVSYVTALFSFFL